MTYKFIYKGKEYTTKQLSRRFGITPEAFLQRLKDGWDYTKPFKGRYCSKDVKVSASDYRMLKESLIGDPEVADNLI